MQDRVCSVRYCDSTLYAKTYCGRHYKQVQTKGSVQPERVKVIRSCSIDGCLRSNRIHKNNGLDYCNKHYLHMRRFGRILDKTVRDPRPAIIVGDIAKIPLGVDAKDGYAIVDKEFAYLDKYKWTLSHWGYVYSSKPSLKIHRVILDAPEGVNVDHMNNDPLDNRKSNLRLCSQMDNSKNQKLSIKNTSGYKGVSYDKRVKKYEAYVKSDYKRYQVGYFDDPREAAIARDKKALELHGEFAKTNAMLGLL